MYKEHSVQCDAKIYPLEMKCPNVNQTNIIIYQEYLAKSW